jgi:hypothetical protein
MKTIEFLIMVVLSILLALCHRALGAGKADGEA